MRRLLVKTVVSLLVLATVILAGGYLYLRQSLPVTSGDLTVDGISGPIEIVRDADNVPHVFASTKPDALYGLGYVHAQDRLWQMEFQRRIGHGRLSEVFGAATIPQDRFLRTVGFGRAAASAWSHLPEDPRRQIDAYVAGVNAFIVTHRGRLLPPEFSLLRFEPAPFTGPDVMVWVKMMAWDLSANYSAELMRHDIALQVGAERMATLLPPYAEHGLSILGASAESAAARPAPPNHLVSSSAPAAPAFSALVRSLSTGLPPVNSLLLGGARTEALGSNNWVVDGTLTASGSPMLASDPHLGTNIPSLWYLAHLSAGDLDLIGATLPGTPAVAIGRNRYIAWGETNVAADVQDFFLERIDPTGRLAEFRGVQEPLRIVPETIIVKGSDPVHLEVRISRHGPIVSDAINANNAESKTLPRPAPLEPMALRWTALDEDDGTVDAFLRLNEARNWDQFTTALRDYVVPSQNFVYGDINGHIGYYAPGRVPLRAGGDGSSPAQGWTGDAEWVGWIPFDQLPHVFDPPEHFIVTANHRPTAPGDPHLISLEYPEPYRAQRILDLLRQKGSRLTPDDFRAIQADTVSLHGRTLVPLLAAHAHPVEPLDRQALELLAKWNFDATGDSGAAAIFEAWFLRLAPAMVGDELGPPALASYRGRFSYITRFVSAALTAGDSPWCDDVGTPRRETCDDVVTSALHDGVVDLRRLLGGDLSRWRWDQIHRAVFPHQGLDSLGLLRPLLSRSLPNGGDWSSVNVGPVAVDTPYEQHSVPGYRQIVDLSPANDSRFLDAVGQSGHFLSPHYDDSMHDWQTVHHRRMRMDRSTIEQGALGRLRLLPRTP